MNVLGTTPYPVRELADAGKTISVEEMSTSEWFVIVSSTETKWTLRPITRYVIVCKQVCHLNYHMSSVHMLFIANPNSCCAVWNGAVRRRPFQPLHR